MAPETGASVKSRFKGQENGDHKDLKIEDDYKRDLIKKNRYDDYKEASREKNYQMRESLLTELFKNAEMRTFYNFFVSILMLLILNTFIYDIVNDGYPDLSFELITWCFGKLHLTIFLWMCMFFSTLFVLYGGFYLWSKQPEGALYDTLGILGYILFTCLLFYYPTKYLFYFDLPIASTFIVVCEQIRFYMKIHSFVRENLPRAREYKRKLTEKLQVSRDDDDVSCPAIEKWLYFLFVPVFIYRDEYPRTATIDWSYVRKCFLEVIGCIFYTYYAIHRFAVPTFKNFTNDVTAKSFVLYHFTAILPGTFLLILLFYGLLHAWLNAFAEMLRFGDRLFYKDWWNAESFSTYYRTWNTVIHDWLFIYVYKDVNKLLGGRSKAPGAIAVFFLSALMHEYLFISAFKFFFPVIFTIYFTFGVPYYFISLHIPLGDWSNRLMFLNLMHGNGMFMSLYAMEWYARLNCPKYSVPEPDRKSSSSRKTRTPTFRENAFVDFVSPRCLLCPSL